MIRFKYLAPLVCILSACTPKKTDVVVVDFGSSATPKISQRLEHFSVPHEVMSANITAEQIAQLNPKALIFSGGPSTVYIPGSPLADPAMYDMDVPILGICYGMQLMAQQLGGRVARCSVPESKKIVPVHITHKSPLYPYDTSSVNTWMYHQDCVEELPPGFISLAYTKDTEIAMAYHPQKQFYGVQFHPERIDKTKEGVVFLDRFIEMIEKRK